MTKLELVKVRKTGDALRRDETAKDFVEYGDFYDLTYKSKTPKMFLKIPFIVKNGEKKVFPATATVKLSRKEKKLEEIKCKN